MQIIFDYNFKTHECTTNKECFQYLILSECFPFKNSVFFFIFTVVFYYDIIDTGRSIKLHSRTDFFWKIRSNVVCPVRLIP